MVLHVSYFRSSPQLAESARHESWEAWRPSALSHEQIPTSNLRSKTERRHTIAASCDLKSPKSLRKADPTDSDQTDFKSYSFMRAIQLDPPRQSPPANSPKSFAAPDPTHRISAPSQNSRRCRQLLPSPRMRLGRVRSSASQQFPH